MDLPRLQSPELPFARSVVLAPLLLTLRLPIAICAKKKKIEKPREEAACGQANLI